MRKGLEPEERLRRNREGRARWWAEHPNYKAEYLAANREMLNERNAARMRIASAAKREEKARARKAAERLAQWAKDNPDKRREARERFRANNPEAHKAHQRDYYQRNKEAIQKRKKEREIFADPEKLRAARRKGNSSERAKLARARYSPTEEQRQRYKSAQREKAALSRRLTALGLPPRNLHRTLASERKANEIRASEFFTRDRGTVERLRISDGDWAAHKLSGGTVSPEMILEWSQLSAKIAQRSQFREAVQQYVTKHVAELLDDISLDNRARELLGKGPLNEAFEVDRRAREAVSRKLSPRRRTVRGPSTDAVNLARAGFAQEPSQALMAQPATVRRNPPSPESSPGLRLDR